MSDALELYRTKKDLPIPDDKVDVKAGSKIIAYQGDIGKNVLETIEYTESGLDPKYKEYFSYYLTKNKKYFQLMAFLEEENQDTKAEAYLRPVSSIFATDYSDKYPFVKGKKLGILTDSENNPIQKIDVVIASGFIDTKTATGYLAYVDNGKKLIGKEIAGLQEIVKLGGIEQNLVAWYDFETIDGTGFLDLSGHHYTGNIIGDFAKIHTGATGPVGKAMKFDGDNTSDYIILPNEVLNGKKDYSVSIWGKFYINTNTENMLFNVASYTNDNEINITGYGSGEINKGICGNFRYPFEVCVNKKYELNNWNHIFTTKQGSEISLYINGKLKNRTSSGVLDGLILKAEGIVIGQDQDEVLGGFDANQAMKGELDDLRIYEGTMSEGRIEKIYKLGKR